MNTWFEVVLIGEDAENLQAAGEAALDEIERVEQLLSRFDPASEVSRINRDAARIPVLLDYEMVEILATCRDARLATEGFFDVAVGCGTGGGFAAIEFDAETRLLAFRNEKTRLDFGGFGKGYALDRAAGLLRENGVKQALLQGGTSSVLALGNDGNGQPWRIGLRHSSDGKNQIPLNDQGLSTSATGEGVSDILNPHTGQPIAFQAACTVLAETAAQAEIFSTALLGMGKDRAASWLAQNMKSSLSVLWSDNEFSNAVYL